MHVNISDKLIIKITEILTLTLDSIYTCFFLVVVILTDERVVEMCNDDILVSFMQQFIF